MSRSGGGMMDRFKFMDRFKKKTMSPPPPGPVLDSAKIKTPVPESAINKTNKRNLTYKIFKGYKPKDKRLIKKNQSLNIAWDLAGNKPSDGVVLQAIDRFKSLDTKKRTDDEEDEFNTLRYLLNQIHKLDLDPSELDRIRGTIFTEEGFAANRAQETVSVDQHSNSLNGTIKRMKCTICQSQSIIDKALNSKAQPRTCNICGASNSLEYEAAAAKAAKNANQLKNDGLGNNPLTRIDLNNVIANNAAKAAAKAAAAAARAEKKAKLNASLQNNGFSIDAAGQGAKAENNAEAAAKAAAEAAAKAAIKARLIQVKNEDDKNVWIDPQTRDVYTNSNAKTSNTRKLGGPVSNDNIKKGNFNQANTGRYWRKDNGSKNSTFIKKNYNNILKTALKGGTRKNRKNRRNTRKN